LLTRSVSILMSDAQINSDPIPQAAVVLPAGGATGSHRFLGELLVEAQLITSSQLAEALAEREKTGAFLAKIVVLSKFISQEDLNTCFVKRCKIPHISLLDYDVGSDVLNLVPQDVCLKHGLIPIDKLGRILTVAMVDPLDVDALDVVRESCPELRIKPILCNWAHFEQVTSKYFGGGVPGTGSGGGGGAAGQAMSAASLGLSALPPKPVAKPAPAPAHVGGAVPAGPAGAPLDTAALVAAIQAGFQGVAKEFGAHLGAPPGPPAAVEAPAFPMDSFAQVIQQAMRDAVAEALQGARQTATPPPLPAAPAPAADWSGLEASFRSAISELKDVVRAPAPGASASAPVAPAAAPPAVSANLEATLQKISEALSREPATPSNEVLAEVIRESVGGAMQEALASVVVQMRANVKSEEPEAPSMERLAETMRDTLGGVMQEVMAAVLVQNRAQSNSDGSAGLEQVAAAVRESQEVMAAALREMLLASQQSQELQSARLAAIAEAAVESSQQTGQLIEATLVQKERAGSLQGRRAPHASVSPFGGPGGGGDDGVHAEDDARVRDALESEVPLETLTFETFFPGEANGFTAKICQAVAAKPGGEYNPLFLYGHVGLGKTHLISAVGNHIKQTNPAHRVGYVSASHFSRRLKEALAEEAQEAFRDNYCHWDVLILDDIQFMGGRVEAQEEFFHIFNVLHQRGRQIIIAGDKAPDRLGLLEQRLVSRFASGIVAELKPPEWETRMKILRHQLAAGGVSLPEEICSLVAMRVKDDIRKMVGSLRKIAAFASMSKEPITVEIATEILSHIGGEEAA